MGSIYNLLFAWEEEEEEERERCVCVCVCSVGIRGCKTLAMKL